jgi:TolA-binding protein
MPDFADAVNNLGVTQAAMGKKKDAYRSYLRAISLRPEWDYALYNLAMISLDLGKRDEARKYWYALKGLNAEMAERFGKQFFAGYVIDAGELK